MTRPTIRQLTYLTALAEHRHFRRAAEACFVSQPALSEQIQALETLLDLPLVERTRPLITLTPAGQETVRRARAILRQTDDLVEWSRSRRGPFKSPVALGVIPTIAPYLIPPMIPDIERAIPGIHLHLREEQTGRLASHLKHGRIDAALMAYPLDIPELDSMALYEEDFVVIAGPDEPLLWTSTLKDGDLKGKQLLLLEEGHCLRDQALQLCQKVGAAENAAFRGTSLGTLVQMVRNKAGITLLPRLATGVELQSPPRPIVFEFEPPAPSRRIGLFWRKTSPRIEEIRILGRAIRANLPGALTLLDEEAR